MSAPIITIIIPSYNHANFISKAIDSVLSQTFQDFELIIIDDGSKDNSIEIIQTFSDPRIQFLVNEINKGAVYTTNKMIEMARGKYIALLNSDDYWEPKKLEKQLEFMEENPQYGAVFSNANFIDEQDKTLKNEEHIYGNIFEQQNRSRFEWLNFFFNAGNCLCHPSILIRKEVYDQVGLYNPLMTSLPDFDMWVRVCLKHEIYVISEKLVNFRILNSEQNASGNNPANIIAGKFEHKQILNHFLSMTENDYENIFDTKIINSLNYSLGIKALENSFNFMNSWGLDILYKEILSNPSYMTPDEFTKLSKKYDVYNLVVLQNKDRQIQEQERLIQQWHDIAQSMRIKNRIKKLFGMYK